MGFCVYIFKMHFCFFLTPPVTAIHQVARALNRPHGGGATHAISTQVLFHGMSQAFKATAKSFSNVAGQGLHSSEREMTVIYATNRTDGCNSKCREDQEHLRAAQCLAAKTASEPGGSALFI